MAGIGFLMRAMNRRDSLVVPTIALGKGALIAAGPWILTVLSIALIHQATAHILSPAQSYNFRGQVIYAFAMSLLATAPVVNVAIRLVADDTFLGDLDRVRGRYSAALIFCAGLSAALSTLVLFGVFGLSGPDLAVGVVSTTIIGLIWPTLAFCGAVRDYAGITLGFFLGLLAAVLATIIAAHADWGPLAMMATFSLGLGVVLFGLASRVLMLFPRTDAVILPQLIALLKGFARYRLLALGSAIAIAALWIDKWIMWFGPLGVPLPNGLVSAPIYDGAMFIAYLMIIPALGLFITEIETTFLEAYRNYYDSIRERGPLSRLKKARAMLERVTVRMLGRVLLAQAILCAVVALAAPFLVSMVGLQFQQAGILRLGAVAALFQFQFLACSSLLLFFEQHGRFLALQILFFVCQAAFTLASIWLGPQYFGFGHLMACAVAGYAAFEVLDRTFRKLDYLTFSAALRQKKPTEQRQAPRREPEEREVGSVQMLPQSPPGNGRARPLLAP
ncbi:MAG: exopolysaccharide Pel transporter PelG [Mesorhizobium sp.]|nr:exopolysaccharide Pel transporter PelG [Mesorhizobium sp.]